MNFFMQIDLQINYKVTKDYNTNFNSSTILCFIGYLMVNDNLNAPNNIAIILL